MLPFILGIAVRAAVVFGLTCAAAGLAQHIAAINHVSRRLQRNARITQAAVFTAVFLSFILETAYYLVRSSRGLAPHSLPSTAWGLTPWAIVTWLSLAALPAAGIVVFQRTHWRRYTEARDQIGRASADPNGITKSEARDLGEKLRGLFEVFPTGLRSLPLAQRARIDQLLANQPEIARIREVADAAESGHFSDALRDSRKLPSLRIESLLLAMELRNWQEMARLLPHCPDVETALEAAQMLAEDCSIETYREVGRTLLMQHGRRGKLAILDWKRQDRESAVFLAAGDAQVAQWLRSQQTGGAVPHGSV